MHSAHARAHKENLPFGSLCARERKEAQVTVELLITIRTIKKGSQGGCHEGESTAQPLCRDSPIPSAVGSCSQSLCVL